MQGAWLDFARDAFAVLLLVAPLLSALFILTGALIALRALRVVRATNWYLKSVDVMLRCNDRYDALLAIRTDLIKRLAGGVDAPWPEEIDAYYRRFWGLQVDQFDYYQLGMIEDEVFIDWSLHKVSLFRDNVVIGGKKFRESFDDAVTRMYSEKKDFRDFFARLDMLANPVNYHNNEQVARELRAFLEDRSDRYHRRQRRWLGYPRFKRGRRVRTL